MREGWTYKKLGEICEIFDSQRKPVTKSDRKSGCYPYYGATGVQDFVDSYIFDGRYLLIGEDGAKWGAMDNSAYIIEGQSWVNNHVHILQTKNNAIDKYLMYYLNYSDLDKYISGAIVRKLTQASLREIQIPLPSKSQQEAIVSELDEINSLLALKREQLQTYDKLAQSLFYEMFGDPVENEKGWEVKKLGELCVSKLKYGSGASAIEFDGNIRYIRITDINEDGSLNQDVKSPSIIEEEYILKEGDIVFARSGATVGKTYLHKNIDTRCLYAGYLIKASVNTSVVLPEYVFRYTQSKNYKDWVELSARAVAQPNINAKQYGDLLIPLPPLSLQQQFATRIEQIESQKQQVHAAIEKLETLLASRMQYWFE